jgi:hypothetical protein
MHKSDPNTRFRYPVPIQEQPPRPTLWTPGNLIACRTQKSFLSSFRAADDTYAAEKESEYAPLRPRSLLTRNKEWAGCLYVDNQAASHAMLENGEMIAVSAGYEDNWQATEGYYRWIMDKNLHSRSGFEYFNILWIEWEDGITY